MSLNPLIWLLKARLYLELIFKIVLYIYKNGTKDLVDFLEADNRVVGKLYINNCKYISHKGFRITFEIKNYSECCVFFKLQNATYYFELMGNKIIQDREIDVQKFNCSEGTLEPNETKEVCMSSAIILEEETYRKWEYITLKLELKYCHMENHVNFEQGKIYQKLFVGNVKNKTVINEDDNSKVFEIKLNPPPRNSDVI
jgi:hypothetical protein